MPLINKRGRPLKDLRISVLDRCNLRRTYRMPEEPLLRPGFVDLIEHFRHSGHTIRLIEFMDVGNVNQWNLESVVPSAELMKTIHDRCPLRPVAQQLNSEPARRYAFEDGAGEIGFISSIGQPFCGDCSRARITADGVFYSCLLSTNGTDLLTKIRAGIDTDQLIDEIQALWGKRADRYSELRSNLPARQPHIEMYQMGG